MPTINLFWPWVIISLGIIIGIVLILRHLSKTMDFSRTFFGRWKERDDRGDDGGIWTSLDSQDRHDMNVENQRMRQMPIPESAMRADLPLGTSEEISDEIFPLETAAGSEAPKKDDKLRAMNGKIVR